MVGKKPSQKTRTLFARKCGENGVSVREKKSQVQALSHRAVVFIRIEVITKAPDVPRP